MQNGGSKILGVKMLVTKKWVYESLVFDKIMPKRTQIWVRKNYAKKNLVTKKKCGTKILVTKKCGYESFGYEKSMQ